MGCNINLPTEQRIKLTGPDPIDIEIRTVTEQPDTLNV
jgi:hypothetical protein